MAAFVTVTPTDLLDIFREEDHDPGQRVKTDHSHHNDTNQNANINNNNNQASDDTNTIRYPSTVQVFQNTILPYDFYIFHENATDFIKLKLLNEIKHHFGKENFNLQENFSLVQSKFNKIRESLRNNIQETEKYYEKEIKGFKPIFEFSVSSIEAKPDLTN